MTQRMRAVLALSLFLSGLAWLTAFSWRQVTQDLQQDFDAFYSAGMSVRDGYSPYDNNMDRDIRTWDSTDFRNSLFLYPPLTARFFVPLTRLSYSSAKAVWTVLSLLCIFAALAAVTRLVWPEGGWPGLLGILGVACWYFPTLYEVHNANIDPQIFLVISAGFALAYRYRAAWAHAAFGACLALAVLLKLDTLLVLPGVFLLRWRPALAGFLLGAGLLGAASLALDGPAADQDYLFNQLGRIYHSGYVGDQKVAPERLQQASPGYPKVKFKDGVAYSVGFQQFLCSASGTQVLAAHSHGLRMLVMALTPLLLWRLAYVAVDGGAGMDPVLAFYYFGLLITLFCAPFTWTQRMFWVLALLPWLLKHRAAPGLRPYLALGGLCMFLIGLPMPVVKGLGFYYCLPTLGLIVLLARMGSLKTGLDAVGWSAQPVAKN